ncbi:MAG: erythromycin esterase family protein, partial [bacterium]
ISEIPLFLDAGFVPAVNSAEGEAAWREIAKTAPHPAIDRAVSAKWWEPPAEAPAPAAVAAWLKGAAIPLVSCEAGHGFADLRPLRGLIGDARVVSLGEATHGTREFFQLKHRMVEWLVTELGFTAFAIEASFAETLMLDRYVTTGKGDPVEAVGYMGFWTWDTEEVVALARWMREYNRTASRPVRFYGFDMQFPVLVTREVARLLRDAAPEAAVWLAPRLAPLSNEAVRLAYAKLPAAGHEDFVAALREAGEVLASAPFPDERARALARLHVQVAIQSEFDARKGSDGDHRDRSMADNVLSLLDLEGPRGKLVLWAHNGHVGRGLDYEMGHHLHRKLGRSHVVFGFAFGEGGFQACDSADGWRLRDFAAPPPPSGSLDATLADLA